jgi:branched-chain amino acid transport system ATP-binding protein
METLLEIKDLTKDFGGLTAVLHLNMVVDKGKIIGLIGPNGSGKTTVFNMIDGFIRPTNGRIIFKGNDLIGFPSHLVAKAGIGRTFQLSVLFNGMTVLQNVMMGQYSSAKLGDWEDIIITQRSRNKKSAILEKAMRTLEFLGLSELKDAEVSGMPHGIKRLIGIALALGNDPELLLLDEPLSGMNAEEIDNATRLIYELRERGVTIFIVEHNMRAIMRICDRIAVLNHGVKIVEDVPEEITKNADVIKAYLGSKWTVT